MELSFPSPHRSPALPTCAYDKTYQLQQWRRGVLANGSISSPVEGQSWSFDTRGNWLQWAKDGVVESRTHNGVNELLTRAGTTLTYDENGNLKSDGTRNYTWDEENHVTATSGATNQYDALGRRIAKTVGGVTTHYIYDGWQVVQEVRSDGVTRSFAYGNYIDEPICMITTTASSSDTVYYLQGNNYNIAALTDEAGRVVERYDVEPYGAFAVFTGKGGDGAWFTGDDVQASASAVGNEIVFQGRTVDGESGDYYFRNRQFGPGVGRFLGRDPIGYAGDALSLYRSLENSTPNGVDPFGWFFLVFQMTSTNEMSARTGTIYWIDANWKTEYTKDLKKFCDCEWKNLKEKTQTFEGFSGGFDMGVIRPTPSSSIPTNYKSNTDYFLTLVKAPEMHGMSKLIAYRGGQADPIAMGIQKLPTGQYYNEAWGTYRAKIQGVPGGSYYFHDPEPPDMSTHGCIGTATDFMSKLLEKIGSTVHVIVSDGKTCLEGE